MGSGKTPSRAPTARNSPSASSAPPTGACRHRLRPAPLRRGRRHSRTSDGICRPLAHLRGMVDYTTHGRAMNGTSPSPTERSIASTANPRAGSWKAAMTDYVELHARSAFSFLEGACAARRTRRCLPAVRHCPAWPSWIATASMAPLDFIWQPRNPAVRAHIGSEITCTDGVTYPLLAETREGYRNLCRLVTRMKLRAKKGEGAATLEEIAEFSPGLICLTSHPDERLLDIFGRYHLYAELQRHHHRDEEARNQAIMETARSLGIPLVATNAPAYATTRAARTARRLHLRAQSRDALRSGPPAGAQFRAPRENPAGNVAPVCRSAGSHRKHASKSLRASNSRSPTWAMNSRAIPSPKARP